MEQHLKNSPMYFKFHKTNRAAPSIHEEIELFYVFVGEAVVEVDGEEFRLNEDDYIMINGNKPFGFKAEEHALVGSFYIDYINLSEMLNQNHIIFWCNSVIDKSSAYDEVRKVIKGLVKEYFENMGIGKIRLVGQYYELLYELIKHFLVSNQDTSSVDSGESDEARIFQISNYVARNFRDKISLSELSERLFLTESYLSKYIKRKFQMNFLEYVNNVRLNHAMDDLLYKDVSITRIALENGFANVGTFNRVFKAKYKMPPKQYKITYHKDSEIKEREENDSHLKERVEAYITNNPVAELQTDHSKISVRTDMNTTGRPFEKVWGRMLNAGNASELLKSNMQDHISEITKRLRIEYVRIWDLYSQEMYIDINAKNGYYNFDKLNRVLDFIVSKGLYPYLELNIKPKKLLSSVANILIADDSELKFRDEKAIRQFFEAFVLNIIDRYSTEQVSQWYFELWREEADEKSGYMSQSMGEIESYLKMFDTVSSIIREYLPKAKVGGAGLSIRFGETALQKFLKTWIVRHNLPDFLSFYAYPYVIGVVNSDTINKTSTDRDYLQNYLESAKEVMQAAGAGDIPIHISEWNSTVANRNILNDSCYKGAFIMNNLIAVLDSVDLLGYWFASDVFADYFDSNALLNGSSGVFSKDGIPKPVYFAFEFMNRLGPRLIDKGDNYIITDTGYNEIRIACHNYKFLNHRYFMIHEDRLDIFKQDLLFEDLDKKTIEYKLDVEKSGIYEIKIHSVNRQYGSVQDEWIRMACPKSLIKEEINYLKQVCVPRLAINHIEAKDKKLTFSTSMDPNEIQLISVKYKYKI